MQLTETYIPVSRIDETDRSYQITTAPVTESFISSIRKMGLLNSPLLQETASGFRIVSGFRRIAACRSAGIEPIPVRIVGRDTSSLDCIRWAIAENAFQRNLNLIEQSRAIVMLSSCCQNGKMLSQLAAELGLSENIGVIQKLKRIANLPSRIQSMILADSISLSMALELEGMELPDALQLASLFDGLKLGLNRQRELLIFFQEIGQREGLSLSQILNDSPVTEILNDDHADRVQKAHALRDYLRRRRYPEITRAEAQFANCVSQLNLDSSITLNPPVNFEGMDYRLTLTFRHIDQLRMQLDCLERIVGHAALEDMITRP